MMTQSLRLLIVEDVEDDALLLVRELRKGGYDPEFVRVETAQELKAAMAGGSWDAVFSDYNLPSFTGLDVLRIVRESGLDLPFILVSGVIGEEKAVEAMKAGAHDYIMKDCLARLVPALERELGDAVVRRERRQAEEALRLAHAELERRVAERTAELSAANASLRDSRRAALNLMEDAVIARREAEEASAELRKEMAERKRVEDALRKSYARLDLLAETAGRLLASDSPQQIVDELCRKVMAYLDCHVFFNFLVDEEAGRLHLNACAGISDEEAKAIEWLDYGVAVCGCAARDACRIVAEDIPNTPDPRTELEKSYGIRAYACHPLMAQGRLLGTLSFGTRTRSRFGNDDLALMKAVTDQVAIAMERRRSADELLRAHDELEIKIAERTEELAATVETLLEQIAVRERTEQSLQRLNRLYAVLSEIDLTIVRVADRDSLFRDFCSIAVEHGGFLLSWVGLVDQEGGEVRTVAASGVTAYLDDIRVTSRKELTGEGPTGIAIREGTYYICNDFQNDPCTGPWHEKGRLHGIRASASVALREEDRVIGALTLYAGEEDFFDEQHVALLRQMAADIAFALGNLKREARRRETEKALQGETLERLRTTEALREKERLLMHQSRLAAMGEMINNIAHQWRQPLNVVGLIVQDLAIAHEANELSGEYLVARVRKAMEVIAHMSRTIDDFRNFFKPDKERKTFRMSQVIGKTLALIEESFNKLDIRIEVDSAVDPLVEGYPNELSQAILNIFNNARDAFMERDTGMQRLVTVRLSEANGRTVVTIADNAGGIAEDIIDRIFDPYFTTKGPDKGTGVGLFMARTIIAKSMNGSLTVRNAGDGAEFTIEV
jgi:C4-dicarboxylate-specific signal transduction histidine kinase